MYRLTEREQNLRRRVGTIQRILGSMRAKELPVAVRDVPTAGMQRIFAAFDKNYVNGSYDEWIFRTNIRRIYASYYERWQPDDAPHRWVLERAYLSVRLAGHPGEDPMSLVCIHCDPLDRTYAYPRVKQGPHLHVDCAEDPLPHCHFALNYCHLTDTLKSVDSLGQALMSLVDMLANELRHHYETLLA